MQLKNLGCFSSQTETWDDLYPDQFLRFLHKLLSGSGNRKSEMFQRTEICHIFYHRLLFYRRQAMCSHTIFCLYSTYLLNVLLIFF